MTYKTLDHREANIATQFLVTDDVGDKQRHVNGCYDQVSK